MNKVWNGRVLGLISASIIILMIILNKLSVYLTSYLYKYNIGKCGKNVVIMNGFRFRNPKTINIENNVIISKNVTLSNGEINTGTIILKNGASIDHSCFIDYSGGIIINQFAHIAFGVYISTHDHGFDYRNKPIGKALEIGEYAFVGSKSIIMHNCNYIGKHAVIGSGSVVTKDVPDFAVVAGNPAKIIKYIN